MIKMCEYPDCQEVAGKTFALVHLCQDHHKEITDETRLFYERRIAKDERAHYHKIQHLTPWKSKQKRVKEKKRKYERKVIVK